MLSSKVKDKGSSPFPPEFLGILFRYYIHMRINLNFRYDKLHLKEIIILIPKYHTNMVSFLTPILGLYGINVKEFINDFDIKTRFINFDVIVPVLVKISKIKTFEITLKTPYIISILSNLPNFSVTKPNIDLLSIYKVSLLKSVFYSNFLCVFHKRIYLSLRKYLSLVIKVNFHLNVNQAFIKGGFLNFKSLFLLKSSLQNSVFLCKLLQNTYGVFISFNNSSASNIGYLKVALAIQNLSIFKVRSSLLSSLTGNKYFCGNTYFVGSPYLNYFLSFLKEFSLKPLDSNFFPLFFKAGANLSNQSFTKAFISAFNSQSKLINFYILKIIYIISIRLFKNLNFLNKKLIFLLNKNFNANISPSTKES
jgi:hypothetical protein